MYSVKDLAYYVVNMSMQNERLITYTGVNAILLQVFKDYYLKTGEFLFHSDNIGSSHCHYIREAAEKFGIFGGSHIALLPFQRENIISLDDEISQLFKRYISNDTIIQRDYHYLVYKVAKYFESLPKKDHYTTNELAFYISVIENYKKSLNQDKEKTYKLKQ